MDVLCQISDLVQTSKDPIPIMRQPSKFTASIPLSPAERRAAKLEAALRLNLNRRKDQARQRAATVTAGAPVAADPGKT
jgi:hypothetical protein